MLFWAVSVLNGLAFGSLLFLLSSGFTLAFGMMRVINVAHGSFYLLGAYVALSLMRVTGIFALALVGGATVVMMLGLLSQQLALKRIYSNQLAQVLFTMGLAFALGDVLLVLWGGNPQVMAPPPSIGGSVAIGPIVFPKYRLFVMAAGLVVAAALHVLLSRTRLGMAVRASVDDEEMAQGVGLNTEALFMIMFGLAAFLAGLGGALGAPFIGAARGIDFEVLPLTLVVVILGGLGSLEGALAGSLFVGVVDSLGKAAFPELSYFTLFAPMAIVLAVRPTGLLGRR
ncbi:MAG: branched-chain amino acid ABC transporter permease [Armatimonadota bacterium]|nr:branched-chain amino acid ABC transporter permease [Armatimonadota bacterium]MDR7465821.1 branched-chain amino acid ABC transporter permease [Armatimonadota bacterium]MDR7498335.1 branched-chain amino acid ABC transporter permease [Armatimonadota bacterium]